jgi:short-subunit dehydrogenase
VRLVAQFAASARRLRLRLKQNVSSLRRGFYGTIYLLHKVGRGMRSRGDGRILITGSITGFIPGSYQAVYNGTKAFLDSFSCALREELKDTGVTGGRRRSGERLAEQD